MRQEKERFFQIIFEENSHVLFRYICGQLNNDRETAKDVLNDVWEVNFTTNTSHTSFSKEKR